MALKDRSCIVSGDSNIYTSQRKNCLLCHAKLLLFQKPACIRDYNWENGFSCPYSRIFSGAKALESCGEGATIRYGYSGCLGCNTDPVEDWYLTTGAAPLQMAAVAAVVFYGGDRKPPEIYDIEERQTGRTPEGYVIDVKVPWEFSEVPTPNTLVATTPLKPNTLYTFCFRQPGPRAVPATPKAK